MCIVRRRTITETDWAWWPSWSSKPAWRLTRARWVRFPHASATQQAIPRFRGIAFLFLRFTGGRGPGNAVRQADRSAPAGFPPRSCDYPPSRGPEPRSHRACAPGLPPHGRPGPQRKPYPGPGKTFFLTSAEGRAYVSLAGRVQGRADPGKVQGRASAGEVGREAPGAVTPDLQLGPGDGTLSGDKVLAQGRPVCKFIPPQTCPAGATRLAARRTLSP